MEIKGLKICEISKKLEFYVTDYFNGCKLDYDEHMFQEGHLLYLEEISEMLPANYLQMFSADDKFLCYNGFVIIEKARGELYPHVVCAVLDEQSERVLLLCVDETQEDGSERIVTIKDFLA